MSGKRLVKSLFYAAAAICGIAMTTSGVSAQHVTVYADRRGTKGHPAASARRRRARRRESLQPQVRHHSSISSGTASPTFGVINAISAESPVTSRATMARQAP